MKIKKISVFICGVDGNELKLVKGKYSFYYRCPLYEREYRTDDDSVCTNCISLRDVSFINNDLQQRYDDGNLTVGYENKFLHLRYKVTSITKNRIEIYVINTRKIKIN